MSAHRDAVIGSCLCCRAGAAELSVRGSLTLVSGRDAYAGELVLTSASPLEMGLCPADLTGDGFVSSADLSVLLAQWGGAGSADLDGSGVVGPSDISMMINRWGACD